MLTKGDIKEIGIELGKVIEQNITPTLDELHRELTEVKGQMVTKSYLDDKLAELEGAVIVRQRKEDQKVNLLIELLRNKSVLQETDVKQLQDIQVFPRS
jgi:uncharacterized protein YydD (DUF2326 family)